MARLIIQATISSVYFFLEGEPLLLNDMVANSVMDDYLRCYVALNIGDAGLISSDVVACDVFMFVKFVKRASNFTVLLL